MFPDITELCDFYHTPLGIVVKRLLRRKVLSLWSTLAGDCVVGLGYTTPLLRTYQAQTPRLFAAMPAQQGSLAGLKRTILTQEYALPFADNSVDRVLLLHAVENTDNLQAMLQDVWRVLANNGKILIIVPNRRSLWAHLEKTPFGHGHAFTIRQAKRLLEVHRFTPLQTSTALHLPPINKKFSFKNVIRLERFAARWFPSFAGVLLIEAQKQVFLPVKAKRVVHSSQVFSVVRPLRTCFQEEGE